MTHAGAAGKPGFAPKRAVRRSAGVCQTPTPEPLTEASASTVRRSPESGLNAAARTGEPCGPSLADASRPSWAMASPLRAPEG